MKTVSLAATRRSLVDRLVNWDDQKRWQEFFDTYWKLIYATARKSGLTDAEAQEVVQETVITVAKKIDKLKYDPAIGSFKGWLLQITRWRIVDQFRKREPGNAKGPRGIDDTRSGKQNGKRICLKRLSRVRRKRSIINSFRCSTATCARNGRRKKWRTNWGSASGRFIWRGIG